VAFKIHEEADWHTGNLAPGTSECRWLFDKTAFGALPQQYKDLLMSQREMVMDAEQAAYAKQDQKKLPLFEKTLTKITYFDEQLAEFRKLAGEPVWNEWIAANADKFDAQGVFDAIRTCDKEAEAAK
jgi:TRAP-type C4-dicarboxylate transport system substrate-binding protein